MSMPDRRSTAALLLVLFVGGVAAEPDASPFPAGRPAPRLGQPVTAAAAQAADLSVFPDGRGLPPGRGNALEGKPLFAARCAACHGDDGRGGTAEELVGRNHPLSGPTPDKTIGNYWPYATTIFDFTRRAMPMTAPGSLTADEVYALTAWLLFANGIIGESDEINARTLPQVRMPNRDGFRWIDARPPSR